MSNDPAAEISRLTAAVERLTQDLERRRRRARTGIIAALLLATGLVAGNHLARVAQAQAVPQPAPQDPAAQAAGREALLNQLPPDRRRDLEQFEQDVAWVSQYLKLYGGQFDPGAMIAVMLGRMAKSVASVPEMRAEMQVMNAKMNALPVMAAEMQGMNAKMGVMAAGMDSTMGRAGRMMPWSW